MDFTTKEVAGKMIKANELFKTGKIEECMSLHIEIIGQLFERVEQLNSEKTEKSEGFSSEDQVKRVNDIVMESASIQIDESKSFENVVGSKAFMDDLKQTFGLMLKYPGTFMCGILPPTTYLLFGLPGNGKTTIAKVVAGHAKSTFNSKVFVINTNLIMSTWMGESEKIFYEIFSQAKMSPHSVLIFDEVDEWLAKRSDKDSETGMRLKNIFLRELDGITGVSKIVVIATTNRPWAIDPAAISRFHKMHYVAAPSSSERTALLRQLLSKVKLKITKREFKKIAQRTQGYSGRDLKNVVSHLWISHVAKHGSNALKIPLHKKNILRAVSSVPPSTKEDDLQQMMDFLTDNGVKIDGN